MENVKYAQLQKEDEMKAVVEKKKADEVKQAAQAAAKRKAEEETEELRGKEATAKRIEEKNCEQHPQATGEDMLAMVKLYPWVSKGINPIWWLNGTDERAKAIWSSVQQEDDTSSH